MNTCEDCWGWHGWTVRLDKNSDWGSSNRATAALSSSCTLFNTLVVFTQCGTTKGKMWTNLTYRFAGLSTFLAQQSKEATKVWKTCSTWRSVLFYVIMGLTYFAVTATEGCWFYEFIYCYLRPTPGCWPTTHVGCIVILRFKPKTFCILGILVIFGVFRAKDYSVFIQ